MTLLRERKEEFRAIPVNEERRNTLIEEMNKLCLKAEEETRSLNSEEAKRFKELEEEVRLLDETIAAEEKLRDLNKGKRAKDPTEKEEEKRFLDFLRTGETRELNVSDNKLIIPNTISNQIIQKIEELAVIFPACTKFYAAGELTFPIDDNNLGITAGYTEDMATTSATGGKFDTLKLGNYIITCLAKVSKSLLNNTTVNVLPYIIYVVAKAITDFIEKELICGSTKMQGLTTTKNVVVAAAADAITADELIATQLNVPTTLKNTCWVMNRNTLKLVRQLKDNEGRYLCGRMADGFGFELLDRPIKVSDNMPDVGANNVSVIYGDLSGMYAKFSQSIEVEVLRELFATQHAIGIYGSVECDAKIVETGKITGLKGAES